MEPKGLGRRPFVDWRDLEHPLTAPEVAPTSHRWGAPRPLDQGSRPWCVAYAWLHYLMAYPLPRPKGTALHRAMPQPRGLYCGAQAVDEWPGDCNTRPDYDGTSVRAGAKVLQRTGLIEEYLWALDIATTLNYVITRGPLVAGTWWYAQMTDLRPGHFAVPKGAKQGGHAYVIVGYDAEQEAFDCLNSWGLRWGRRGRFYVSVEDMEGLLLDGGEMCSAIEVDPSGR